MLNFQCTQCKTEIQSEYQYIGELVECPICNSLQIVSDPILRNGSEFHGYLITQIKSSTMLWDVYEAVGVSELPGKHVIIRIPTTFFLKNVSNFDQFVETIVKAGSLNIEFIPTLLDRSTTSGKVYFAYSYIKEAHKISYFKDDNQIEIPTTLLIIKKIAQTLDKLWKKEGIIHQNLRPSNIKITEKLNIRINNVGISKFLLNDQSLLQYGFNIWDYHYMSPEFITDGIADTPSCDIYALGGIFFQLLTGSIPYKNISPKDIATAPTPSAISLNSNTPKKVNTLISLMMAPNPSIRLKKWSEVIERIDEIIKHNYFNAKEPTILKNKKFTKTKTVKHQQFGMHAGEFKKQYIKTSTEKFNKQKSNQMTDTVAKLASKGDLIALNNKWNKKQSQASKKKAGKSNINYIPFIAVAIISLIAGLILYFFYTSNEAKKIKENKIAKQKLVDSNKLTLEQKEKDLKNQKNYLLAQKIKKQKKLQLSKSKIKDKVKDKILSEMHDIDKFLKENPSKKREALKRYDSIVTDAALNEKFNLANIIQEKINNIKDAENDILNNKIKIIINIIKKEIKPLLKDGEYDKALIFLREYNGILSKESKKARLNLAKSIEIKIQSIKESKTEDEKSAKIAITSFAKHLINDEMLKANVQIELEKEINKNESTKQLLEHFATQLNYYNDLKDKLKKDKDGNLIIEISDEKLKTEKPHILIALLYLKEKQFLKSKEAFNQLPYNCGEIFLPLVDEKEAKVNYINLLNENNLKFNLESNIIEQLSKNKIKIKDANKLNDDIANFTKKFSNTLLFNNFKNDINAITNYCNIITKESKEKEITIKNNIIKPSKDKSKSSLIKALENAQTGSQITLTNGVYELDDLTINQVDLTLIGDNFTTIRSDKTFITNHNIHIKNITFTNGQVIISKGYNITFENCKFYGKETQIKNSKNITFINSIIHGVKIDKTIKLLFRHCTFVTPKGGIEASIRIEKGEIEVIDSIIYGKKYGVMIMNDYEKSRKYYIHNTLWFAEKAFAVRQLDNSPLEKKHIASKSNRIRKFIKTKANIYKQPLFINPDENNYNLHKGAYGTQKASDKTDCGAFFKVK